jgi:mono/diheme cytochrome c family protein
MIPFQYAKTKEGMELAGKELVNPLVNTTQNLQRGKEVYDVFCIHCHGEKGDGKGFLHTSGKYIYPPASLVSKKMTEKPDGEIYHSVTLGFGLMGAHGSQIRPDDRWKLIMYIRNELQK